jgi:hypothetical protein
MGSELQAAASLPPEKWPPGTHWIGDHMIAVKKRQSIASVGNRTLITQFSSLKPYRYTDSTIAVRSFTLTY